MMIDVTEKEAVNLISLLLTREIQERIALAKKLQACLQSKKEDKPCDEQ